MFKFKLLLSSISISLLCVGLLCSSTLSATLVVEDGVLMGATDVLVNEVNYDVYFLDSTIADLYNGADETSDFALYYSDDASDKAYLVSLAAEALLEQVFVGLYDAQPTLINGVYTHDAGTTAAARVVIPYSCESTGTVDVVTVWKWSSEYNGHESSIYGPSSPTWDSSPTEGSEKYDETVISVWTIAEKSSVPIPGAIFLLGSGLMTLTGLRRKKSNKA